jgi:protein gp37
MNSTTISWTDFSWNPWSGCKQISPGCAHCYALTLAENKRGTLGFPNGFDLTYRWHKLDDPLKKKQPSRIFVNSMSDLYFEEVSDDNIRRVFEIMNHATWHKFQILTKRSQRMVEIANKVTWTANIWQGVSVENQHWTKRIDDLARVPARIKFVSAEPLLGPVDLSPWLDRIQWVIVGGESGSKYRRMDLNWARSIRDQCERVGVAFHFKQGNGYRSGMATQLDGVEYSDLPIL